MNYLLSVEDYQTLELADITLNGKVASVLGRNGKAGWTVCPICHVDDFTHVEGCELADRGDV